MSKTATELAAYIQQSRPVRASVALGELMLEIDPEHLIPLMDFLKNDPGCRFSQAVDICGVDYPKRAKRFDVVYNLLSPHLNHRVRVKLSVAEEETVPSVTGIYSTAGWFEREVWDMYGVYFSGNPDLRRILTDYGFDGHPQRKDFPLTGYVELRYDPERRHVVYSPVQLPQAYRVFDFLSPWEGAEYLLPGDEKAEGSAALPRIVKAGQ